MGVARADDPQKAVTKAAKEEFQINVTLLLPRGQAEEKPSFLNNIPAAQEVGSRGDCFPTTVVLNEATGGISHEPKARLLFAVNLKF